MRLKRVFVLAAMLVATVATASAQQLTMSIKGEPVEDPNDLDASAYYPVKDQNDNTCALLKVTTTDTLNNALVLEVGGMGVTKRVERPNGEIWFYLPAQVKNLHFSCYGYTKPAPVVAKFKPGKVYRLTIHTDATIHRPTYKVGDYYDDGTKQGVVFEVRDGGRHGKIVSLTESSTELLWSDVSVAFNKIGTDSRTDGGDNMKKVQSISGWRELYPAFRWCADLGEEWYLPAIEELMAFIFDESVHNAVNATLKFRGATQLYDVGKANRMYWSSTEFPDNEFSVWFVDVNGSRSSFPKNFRDYGAYVRAVSAF